MSARLLSLIVILFVLATGKAHALQMPIYEGTVILGAGQAESDEAALREALVQVLVKVSGDRSLPSDAGIGAALTNVGPITLSASIRTREDGARILIANFDPGSVHERLTLLGRGVWQADRPPLLIWLGIDDGSRKQIASASQIAALGVMTERAHARGIPLLLPKMDSVDQNRINPVTFWAAPSQTFVAAGLRYGVKTMLVIRLSHGSAWQAHVTLIDGQTYESWSQDDAQSNTLLANLVDAATDRLARRYAIEAQGTALGEVTATIEGMRDATDYAGIVGYLRKLEFVRDLQVLGVKGERIELNMQLAVGAARLKQLLRLDGRLELEVLDDHAARLRVIPGWETMRSAP